jgi:UDP-3-O-[3-hydroxymyristoyl] N-acetylglucosamine deacetylase
VSASAYFQHTVAGPVIFAGVGLHTGSHVRVAVRPAPVDAGVVFVRTDVHDRDNRVPVKPDAVCQTQLGTVINNAADVRVSTIEHLMAALAALAIDNCVVELDGPEVPIMDGSSEPFVQILDRAGRRKQEAARRYIEILTPSWSRRATSSPACRRATASKWPSRSPSTARPSAVSASIWSWTKNRSAPNCPTAAPSAFVRDVEALRAIGLARGGSMENAVVIDGDRVLNPEGLRRPDEFVRHKALDAVGDLYVLGAPIIGRFEGVLAGHGLNNAIVRALMANPSAWRMRNHSVELAQAV